MHKLLERQLKRLFSEEQLDRFTLEQQNLLEVISQTYEEFNKERRHIEHTLELNARELEEVNRKIRIQNEDVLNLLQQYKYAIDTVLIVSITDTRGIITYANDNFCTVSGYERDELIGSSHRIVRHPDNDPSVFEELWERIAHKEVWQKIIPNKRKGGETYYVSTTILPLVDKHGTIIEYMGISEDITEQIVFQRQLEENERRTSAILNNQESIVVIFRQSEGVIEANQKFYDGFGFRDFDAFRAKHQCVCELFIEKEGYLKTSTETTFWTEPLLERPDQIHRAIIRDASGELRTYSVKLGSVELDHELSYISTFTDITELEKAREKAEKAEKVKAEFLANMSHEIRTPMNGIFGFIQLLATTPLEEKQKQYVHLINDSTKILMTIINDILDFSKIESGKIETEKVPINPFEEFENTFLLLSEKANEKRLVYRMHIDPDISSCIRIDSVRIKQVLLNLIGNAIKFTPVEGSVLVDIERVSHLGAKETIRVSVRDTGIGIPLERQEKIFDPFSQADSSTTRQFGGTGLGLSISRSLVEIMGGKLELESAPDEGSRFFFTLEVEACVNTPSALGALVAETKEASGMKPLEHLQLLIAEDYEINRILMEELLSQYKIAYDFAINGEEAVAMAEARTYDAILMDINMPVMNGIEATRRIRLFDSLTPIVALTANALEGDREKFMQMGMAGYLTKPIDVSELQSILSGLCKMRDEEPFEELSEDEIRAALAHTSQKMGLSNTILNKFLESFFRTIGRLLSLLHEGIETGDFEKIELAMHDIRSGIATLGLDTLSSEAKLMEEHARRRQTYDYAQGYRYLEKNITQVQRYYEKYIQQRV